MEQENSGRALVVGGDSLVGSALQVHCRKLGLTVDASSRRAEARQAPGAIFLDLGDPDFTPLAQLADYDVAFVCAAVTSMQACQSDPALSRRINVDNTLDLMRRLADRGTHLVFLSSSQVFDGETPMPDEAAPTAPKNEYGAQKLAVEQAIERRRAAGRRPARRPRFSPIVRWASSRAGSRRWPRASPCRPRPTWRCRRSWSPTSPRRPSGSPPDAIAASGTSARATTSAISTPPG